MFLKKGSETTARVSPAKTPAGESPHSKVRDSLMNIPGRARNLAFSRQIKRFSEHLAIFQILDF